jgi:hypothetical protein
VALRILDWDLCMMNTFHLLAKRLSSELHIYSSILKKNGGTFPPKFSYISQKYHGVMTQMTIIFT